MGLILDSSVIIDAERRGETVERLIERIVGATGDQDAALSAVGLTEIVHGIYRASTPTIRSRREAFLEELLADLRVSLPKTLFALRGRVFVSRTGLEIIVGSTNVLGNQGGTTRMAVVSGFP
jgi:predicted nucleic acid-binding protein